MQQENRHWHLDRRVSVGHLVTTVTVLVAMVLWGARLETRLVVIENTADRQTRIDTRQDEESRRMREEIREELKSLNNKIDRYFEQLLNRSR